MIEGVRERRSLQNCSFLSCQVRAFGFLRGTYGWVSKDPQLLVSLAFPEPLRNPKTLCLEIQHPTLTPRFRCVLERHH